VVEIGSGTGDFLKFLLNRNVIVQSYSGLDILDDMTKRLSNRFADFSNISAETVDFLEWKGKRPDLIFAFSVFDRKIGSQMATERYAFDMLERMYEMSKEGVYCTFLASWKNIENIDEALFSPSAVLEFAHRISERVVLDCSFMLMPLEWFCIRKLPDGEGNMKEIVNENCNPSEYRIVDTAR